MNGNRGSISLLKILQPTRHIVELMCSWAESLCVHDGDWRECHKNIDILRSGDPGQVIYNKVRKDGKDNIINNPYYIRLIRIMNGSLYYDWPWNRKQFDVDAKATPINPNYYTKFHVILSKLSDIKDSVFFNGVEMPYLPWNFPFPALSESPSLHTMDIPVPWIKAIEEENGMYQRAFVDGEGIGVYTNHHSATFEGWLTRINKAAFYGTLMPIRGLVYSLAQLNPDLIDAGWPNACCPWRNKPSWNPESLEDRDSMEFGYGPKFNASLQFSFNKSKLGFLESYLGLQIEHGINYVSKKYKYLIVLAGLDGQATSGRLAHLIAHSGAVVLLQTTEFEYHFSARLKPWVHFVPIAYNAADLIEKIRWLQNHELMAYRIAQNAKIFGESYLRLEDNYCYMATLMKTLGDLFVGSSALQHFDAKPIEGIPTRFNK